MDLEAKLAEHAQRLSELERGHRELAAAVNKIATSTDSRRELIEYRFNRMDERFNKLDGNINKMLWLIGAALIGGVMQFIANGGLVSG